MILTYIFEGMQVIWNLIPEHLRIGIAIASVMTACAVELGLFFACFGQYLDSGDIMAAVGAVLCLWILFVSIVITMRQIAKG